VQTVGLTWQHAAELGGALALGSAALHAVPQRQLRRLAPFAFEAAILATLYALWQLAAKWSVTGYYSALDRARWIERFEHDVFLPSEKSVQHLILGHPLWVQGANLYYDTMHFTTMLIFLVWLFVRHRDHYRPVRATMAWATLICLLVQLIPVAPPRMLPGFVDTAVLYNQSVYSSGLAVDQLSAMPSVHVAWAVVVGWYAVKVSTSRFRWCAAGHTAMTVFCVVATANHWWLDGIVATVIVVVAAWWRVGLATLRRALVGFWQVRAAGPAPADPEPEPAPV
jgi:hypothetical protein